MLCTNLLDFNALQPQLFKNRFSLAFFFHFACMRRALFVVLSYPTHLRQSMWKFLFQFPRIHASFDSGGHSASLFQYSKCSTNRVLGISTKTNHVLCKCTARRLVVIITLARLAYPRWSSHPQLAVEREVHPEESGHPIYYDIACIGERNYLPASNMPCRSRSSVMVHE